MNIYIDADSCPVKEEAVKVAFRHDLSIYMVSNKWITNFSHSKIHKILVAGSFDAADNWIEEHIYKDDIAITNDILLASRCINKMANAIAPNGKIFSSENIGISVAMRELNAHLRETGEISGHNASFSKFDRSNFLQNLEKLIQQIKR
jgi:uncharacterized protein YaiI (UPF0178 family)